MDFSNPPPIRASAAQAGYQAGEVAKAIVAYRRHARRSVYQVHTSDEDTRIKDDADGSALRHRRQYDGRGGYKQSQPPDSERLLDVWA